MYFFSHFHISLTLVSYFYADDSDLVAKTSSLADGAVIRVPFSSHKDKGLATTVPSLTLLSRTCRGQLSEIELNNRKEKVSNYTRQSAMRLK